MYVWYVYIYRERGRRGGREEEKFQVIIVAGRKKNRIREGERAIFFF